MTTAAGIVIVSTLTIAGLLADKAIDKGYNNIEVDVKNQKLNLEKNITTTNSIEE